MTRRPLQPRMSRLVRTTHAQTPSAKKASESPTARLGPARPPRQISTPTAWTYDDFTYFFLVSQTSDGLGADTRFAEANGQDYANDGIADEEALIMSETTHDTYGGSPWTTFPGGGAVIQNIGGSQLRLDNNGTYPTTLVGTQLSWPVDLTLQEMWTEYYKYEGAEADYGYSGTFPDNFNDAWITGYQIRFYARGGLNDEVYIQYVSDLPDDTPDYLESGVTVHPKIYVPWTGNDWNDNVYIYDEISLPASTPGMPKAAWTGKMRMRIGMDEKPMPNAEWDRLIDIDYCRVYVYYTISL